MSHTPINDDDESTDPRTVDFRSIQHEWTPHMLAAHLRTYIRFIANRIVFPFDFGTASFLKTYVYYGRFPDCKNLTDFFIYA